MNEEEFVSLGEFNVGGAFEADDVCVSENGDCLFIETIAEEDECEVYFLRDNLVALAFERIVDLAECFEFGCAERLDFAFLFEVVFKILNPERHFLVGLCHVAYGLGVAELEFFVLVDKLLLVYVGRTHVDAFDSAVLLVCYLYLCEGLKFLLVHILIFLTIFVKKFNSCAIMQSRDYYQSIIRIIEHINDTQDMMLPCSVATQLAGEYWPQICQDLADRKIGVMLSGGRLSITQPQFLSPLYADAHYALEQLRRLDEDRELDNLMKKDNIRYGRRGYRISLVALCLSAAAIAIELIRLLQDLG